MDNKSHISNSDDFLRDALGNYEAPYNPKDWLEMGKLLDLKGSPVLVKKSFLAKLAGGILSISIAVFCTLYYIYEKPSGSDEQIRYDKDEMSFEMNTDQAGDKENTLSAEGDQLYYQQDAENPGINGNQSRFSQYDNASGNDD